MPTRLLACCLFALLSGACMSLPDAPGGAGAASADHGAANTPPALFATARAQLAPTGTLRAGMNLGNTLFTTRDPASGTLAGVSVDLMHELGARLGVPVEFVVHDTPGQVADAVDGGRWDVAILAIEPARARRIAFSPPMTEIEATYVVQANSTFRSPADVDAPGVRICAPAKAGYELYLTRTLARATLIRTLGDQASADCLNRREADAVAGLRPMLVASMARFPSGRLLDGRFMTVNHGLGTPVERTEAARYLAGFARDVVASGFLARSIQRHQVQGLSAAR